MIQILQLLCCNFFMIEISCLYEKTKQYQISHVKTCYMTKPFGYSKIKDTRKFKRNQKKNQKLPPFGKFVEAATRGAL